jgi:hypothetical protein
LKTIIDVMQGFPLVEDQSGSEDKRIRNRESFEMDVTPQRRDCDLSLREAKEGDLPPVCIGCGEATNQFCPVSLYHRWKRIVLRLPLCDRHKNDWRRRSYALGAAWFGFFLLIAGLILVVFSDQPPSLTITGMVAMAAVDLVVLGLILFYGCLCLYVFLMARGIQIRRLNDVSVTLTRVAPEFLEALRSYDPEPLWESPNVRPSVQVLRVLEAAHQAAHRLQHEYLGTDHILLGLWTRTDAAAEILQHLPVSAERIEVAIVQATPAIPGYVPPNKPVCTPQVRRAIQYGVAQAQAHPCKEVNACQLLLGLLHEEDGQAAQILLALGIDLEELRARLLNVPEHAVPKGKPERPASFGKER